MTKQEYSEKLKDPRWLKKKTEILVRDEYRCKRCRDVNTELHVHHDYYLPNKDPWDYEDNCYVTLCKFCHDHYHKHLFNVVMECVSQLFYLNFDASDIENAFRDYVRKHALKQYHIDKYDFMFIGEDESEEDFKERRGGSIYENKEQTEYLGWYKGFSNGFMSNIEQSIKSKKR
jgi:hypothetical protein